MIKKINEQDIFAVNPNFEVHVHQLGDTKCVIVDNFYLNPEKVRELALSIPASKSMIRNTYPGLSISLGINLTSLADTFVKLISENFNDGPRKIDKDIRKTFDFITAAQFVSEVSQLSYQYRKIDGWSVFAISGLGINIDDLFQMSYNGENKIDDTKIISDTTNYINQYKELKLNYLRNFSQDS